MLPAQEMYPVHVQGVAPGAVVENEPVPPPPVENGAWLLGWILMVMQLCCPNFQNCSKCRRRNVVIVAIGLGALIYIVGCILIVCANREYNPLVTPRPKIAPVSILHLRINGSDVGWGIFWGSLSYSILGMIGGLITVIWFWVRQYPLVAPIFRRLLLVIGVAIGIYFWADFSEKHDPYPEMYLGCVVVAFSCLIVTGGLGFASDLGLAEALLAIAIPFAVKSQRSDAKYILLPFPLVMLFWPFVEKYCINDEDNVCTAWVECLGLRNALQRAQNAGGGNAAGAQNAGGGNAQEDAAIANA